MLNRVKRLMRTSWDWLLAVLIVGGWIVLAIAPRG
jgi:hypothetical protein